MAEFLAPSPSKEGVSVDLHMDTPWLVTKHGQFNLEIGCVESKVNTSLLKRGGPDICTFALYLSDPLQDILGPLKSRHKINEQWEWINNQPVKSFIAMEGGRLIHEDLTYLDKLKKMCVKYLTLTHNRNTSWADSSVDPRGEQHGGLTKFGKDVIIKLNEVGIIPDVSHCSNNTIIDTLITSNRPVCATHSGCHKLVDHPRNLTDSLIKQIAKSGGFIGIPFVRKFLGRYSVAQHIDYIVNLAGINHVAIGSDIDGAALIPQCDTVADWQDIVYGGLSQLGYKDSEISKIAGGNVLNLFNSKE